MCNYNNNSNSNNINDGNSIGYILLCVYAAMMLNGRMDEMRRKKLFPFLSVDSL